MIRRISIFISCCATMLLAASTNSTIAATVRLEDLDLSQIKQSYHQTGKDISCTGKPLKIGTMSYEHGLGVCSVTCLQLDLGGNVSEFTSDVGVDAGSTFKDGKTGEERPWGQAEFIIITEDKNILWRSGVMNGGEGPKSVKVDLTGVKKLRLYVTSPRPDWIDNADWADAKFTVTGDKSSIECYRDKGEILTPKPSLKPQINGARVFGVRPGSPFLFTIPATGTRPMSFSAKGLPKGLNLDPANGRITGTLSKPGTYNVTVTAKNKLGKNSNSLHIVCGDKIALTPPMGWNNYNMGQGPTEKLMRAVADAFLSKDLINHGWTYVNADDGWNARDRVDPTTLALIPDPAKFPDFQGMCDYIHSLGLKVGLYSSPWVRGYGGCPGESANDAKRTSFDNKTGNFGAFTFEKEDVDQWVKWGIDYMKYDWVPIDIPHTEQMSKALRAVPRDIVYSLSNAATLEWADDYVRLANCWRTTGDIGRNWNSMATVGFDSQDKWRQYAGPGHWNDADMMMVGHSVFTPDEHYTHMSLWCLLSAPLLLGFDVTQADDFMVGLLTNDEVIAVNQDPLGKQAARLVSGGDIEVWAKDMKDGSKAVGIFNRGLVDTIGTINWSDLKISGKWKVRDLWRQKDLGVYGAKIDSELPWHGCQMFRMWQIKNASK